MDDKEDNKEQLLQELTTLRQRIEVIEAELKGDYPSDRSDFATQSMNLATINKQLQGEIEKRRVVEKNLQQRNRELRLLNRVSQAFISTLDLDSVLSTVLEEVRQALEVVACSAWLIDPDTNEIVCRQVTDPRSEVVRGWRLPLGKGLVGWVAVHGESLNVRDAHADKQHFKEVDHQTGLALRSILSVPLRVKEWTIGVIQAVDAKVNRFTAADLALLESLAATAAIAIENVRLYEQARQDAKTKTILLNEVNHRVKNNLAAIIGLLYAERRHLRRSQQPLPDTILTDLINRIQGLGVVHSMLSVSEWRPLALRQLTQQIIHSALQALPSTKQVRVEIEPSSIRVTAKQANSLTLVINELTTNFVKYALEERTSGQIAVHIELKDDIIYFEFQDDGPGYPADVLLGTQHYVDLYLIRNIVQNDLQGTVTLTNKPGATAMLQLKSAVMKGTENVQIG
jgi:two-component sensor histidine kinase